MQKQTDLAWFCLTKDHCAASVLLEVGAGISAAAGQCMHPSPLCSGSQFLPFYIETHTAQCLVAQCR